MTLLVTVKVLGDLFFYFAFIALLSNFTTIEYPLFVPALIFSASSGLGQLLWSKKDSIPILKKDKKNIIIKILPMLPCLVTFALISTPMDLIWLIPPIIYVGIIICKRKFNLVHREYIEYFKNMFIIVVFLFIICILTLDWKSFLLYESGFIICGIFLMRQLRLYTGNDLKGNFANLSSMLLVILISGVVFCIVYAIIQNSDNIWSVIRHPVSLLVYLISAVLYGILWIFNSFISLFGDGSMELPAFEMQKSSETMLEIGDNSQTSTQPILQILLIATAVIIIFILIFKMLRNLRKEAVTIQEDSDYEMVVPAPSSKKLRPSKLFKYNREKVRLSYIKYLKSLEKEYGKFGAYNTSKDIYDKTSEYSDTGKTLELRELYIRARYDLDREISDNDAQAAKKLTKEITKNH